MVAVALLAWPLSFPLRHRKHEPIIVMAEHSSWPHHCR
jgi:hypothetical protein